MSRGLWRLCPGSRPGQCGGCWNLLWASLLCGWGWGDCGIQGWGVRAGRASSEQQTEAPGTALCSAECMRLLFLK